MNQRINDVLNCPDFKKFDTHTNAGEIKDGILTMHNGIRVLAGSYPGDAMTSLLRQTKGIHEPQEELVFGEVLKHMPAGSSMLELGAWWGFYSMWFATEVEGAKNYLIEPERENLDFGV